MEGLNPNLRLGSTHYCIGGLTVYKDEKRHADINYLASFGLDAGLWCFTSCCVSDFKYLDTNAVFNRLAKSPDYKEYDNQVKVIVNFRLFQN